jgi:hypothetical protein
MIAAMTGLIAGMIHVWSGPDHLAAIAPLAVRRPVRPWVPGVRWGIGHSAGVAVVGLISLWLRDLLPKELLSTWGERLVGVMLIGLGLWALRQAIKVHAHVHDHEGNRHLHLHAHNRRTPHDQAGAHLKHTHAALGIGILHGLAGSSHFLGVLPALAFPTHAQAFAYLAAFALGTVLSMAAFSSIMGVVAARCGNGTRVYRGLMAGCACTALAVGGFWLLHQA